MEYSTKRLERVDLVRVSGRVDHQTAPNLEKALRAIVDDGRHNIIVDLGDVSYISSAGLKVLQATAKSVRGGLTPGDVRLLGLKPHLKEVFDTIGFTSLFKIYDDAVDAVGSF
jgi:anti-sigma B factor antagonist